MWAALKDIQDLCRRHHIELVVAIFPFFYNLDGDYPFRPIHEQLTRRGEQAGIRVLDLYPAFKTSRGPELWVHPVDQHPNEKAHAIVANALFRYLMDNRQPLHLFEPTRVAQAPRDPMNPSNAHADPR
jgi:hypothetical protein